MCCCVAFCQCLPQLFKDRLDRQLKLKVATLIVPLPGPQESRKLKEISLSHGGQSEGPDCAKQGRAEGDR